MKILSIFKLVIVFIAFYYLFTSDNFNFNQLFKKEYFNKIEFFIFVVILISTTYFIGSLRWWLILRSLNYNINFKEIIQITYIGAFFNNVLFGAYGGDLVKGYYIYKYTNNSYRSTFTILLDRGIGFIGLFIIGIFSFILIFGNNFDLSSNQSSISIIIFCIFLLIFFFYLANKIKHKYIPSQLNKFLDSLLRYIKNNKFNILIYIFLSAILFSIVHFGVYLIADHIFNFNIGIKKIFFLNFFTTVTNAIPLTPGGIGLGEVTFVKTNELFFLKEVYIKNLANIIVLYRLFNLVVCIPGAVIYIFQKKKL